MKMTLILFSKAYLALFFVIFMKDMEYPSIFKKKQNDLYPT